LAEDPDTGGQAPTAQLVMELDVDCDPPQDVGALDGGHCRMIPITGGTFAGPRISGEVLPGGADWSIVRANGLSTVDARYAIRASDGTIIQVFNGATAMLDRAQIGSRPYVMVTSPRFIAPEGAHDWLNHGVFVGTLALGTEGGLGVTVRIYRMA
jgi:hypothetical protein